MKYAPTPITNAQFALDCISEALLGPNYYITFPITIGQCNTVIVDEILRTYSKDYRKLVKKKKKETRNSK